MKKLFSILMIVLCAVLTFSLVACDDGNVPPSEPNDKPPGDGTKTLVVYFSQPDNVDDSTVEIDGETLGNTQYMAYVIQENTGADIFRIVPETPYPTTHSELVDLAQKEQRNNARPEIKDKIENFSDYGTVFVGYPNWWGDMPMIMYTFFETYDFSGKTVIPFNTHGGSGFSGTISAIRNLEPNATVKDGKSISRNVIQDAEQEIADWVKSLGFAKPSEEPSKPAKSKVLVVYYSAQNHTEAVANYIATATGGDLFELVPVNPYSNADLNWTDQSSRVVKEHNDESLRNVELTQTTVDNWADYDTVFVGYPIWWGIAAWPVNSFITSNDFAGKTVIPFCTSSSSPLGQSGTLLAEMAGSGNWQEGRRFSSGVSQSTVEEWVRSLELSA